MIDTDVRVICDTCHKMVTFSNDVMLERKLNSLGWILYRADYEWCSTECAQAGLAQLREEYVEGVQHYE